MLLALTRSQKLETVLAMPFHRTQQMVVQDGVVTMLKMRRVKKG
jgi:hypothetical protein